MNVQPQTVIADETMPKKDFQQVQLQNISNGGAMKLALNSFAELEKFSHFMALSNFVPKHLRGKQADCLAVLLQSMRWEMDPFAVAQKTYFVNDGMAYEAQLVNAIILSRAPLKARPKLKWSGSGEDLKCEVTATFIGEDVVSDFEAEMKTITTRNSPLWKQQPKQQLAYFALRAWARLYCPDVLMGVYTKEEMEDSSFGIGPDNAIDVTPRSTALEDINEQIKKATEKKAEPEKELAATSEEKTNEKVVAQNQEAAISKIQPDSSEFDLVKYNLDTQTGNREAAEALLKVLGTIPQEERPSLFMQVGGSQLLESLSTHGLALTKKKFTNLGISLQAE